MAGNAAAVKNFLRDRFGFAQPLQDAFVDEQGFSEWNDGRDLTMEDIETMCKNMRRPGGTIPNPRAATAGQPATIPNPGINVGYVQERQLKQMVVQIQYLAKVQRTFTPAQATLALLTQSWRAFIEDKHIATEMTPSPPKCTKTEDMRKTWEAMEGWLLANHGDSKIPLAYVTREHMQVRIGASIDPMIVRPRSTSTVVSVLDFHFG